MSRTLQAALIALCIMTTCWLVIDACWAIVQMLQTLRLISHY